MDGDEIYKEIRQEIKEDISQHLGQDNLLVGYIKEEDWKLLTGEQDPLGIDDKTDIKNIENVQQEYKPCGCSLDHKNIPALDDKNKDLLSLKNNTENKNTYIKVNETNEDAVLVTNSQEEEHYEQDKLLVGYIKEEDCKLLTGERDLLAIDDKTDIKNIENVQQEYKPCGCSLDHKNIPALDDKNKHLLSLKNNTENKNTYLKGNETNEDAVLVTNSQETSFTQETSNTGSSSTLKSRKKYIKPLKYICHYCDRRFPQSDVLRNHIYVHSGERPFECEFCCLRFRLKSSLKRHHQMHTGKKHRCKQCNRSFVTRYNLQQHMLIHENKLTFKCIECSSTFISRFKLYMHITRTHGKPKEPVVLLERLSGKEIISNAAAKFECDECKKKFTSKESVREHIKHQHLNIKRKQCCKVCGIKSDKTYCLEHRVHTDFFTCSVCKLNFTDRKMFRNHVTNIHQTEKPYGCNLCNDSFKVNSNLTIHIQIHHRTDNHKFVCDICNMSFNRETYLKRHKQTHTQSDRKFSCDLCPIKCRSKTDIKRHLQTHFGGRENPFQCEVCHASFSKPSKLSRHKLVHATIKPYKCDLCDKSYKDISSLKCHKNIHEGVIFTCDSCGHQYTNEHAFKRHIRLKICEKKSYSCQVCGKSLTSEKFYRNHMLKFHSENE